MHPVFTKAFDAVTADDVRALIGWPEGQQVEFKREVPEIKGQRTWAADRDLASGPRDSLLKEVVAFANAAGGHLLVGVEQSDDEIPVATGIRPIPACADLADRLGRSAASGVDQVIPNLQIRAIPTEEDGAGVVLVRVPESSAAPHRVKSTRIVYLRRNASSDEVTSMRDVHMLVLAAARRGELVEQRVRGFEDTFNRWLGPHFEGKFGTAVHVSAVPIGWMPTVTRLFNHRQELMPPSWTSLNATFLYNSRPLTYGLPFDTSGHSDRPILRGVRREDRSQGVVCEVFQDGAIDFRRVFVRGDDYPDLAYSLPISWLLGCVCNALIFLHRFRSRAGAPEAEYALHVHALTNSSRNLTLLQLQQNSASEGVGKLEGKSLSLDYSVLDRTGFDELVSNVVDDCYDACGAHWRPRPVTVNWPE